MATKMVRRIRLLALVVVFTQLLTACSLLSDAVDPVVNAFNSAIATLDSNSSQWQSTLKYLEDDLIKRGQQTISNQVKDVLDGSIANVGDEARCSLDFIGVRVKQQLIALRAQLPKWTGSRDVSPPAPHLCTVVPNNVPLDRVNDRSLSIITFHGYDLTTSSGVKLAVLDPRGEHAIASALVASPSPYQMTLNVARTNGVQFPADAQKIVVRDASNNKISDVSVVGATPPPPPPPAKLSNLQIVFHTNNEDKDDDTGVQVTVGNVTEWHQEGKMKFDDNGDFRFDMRPSVVNRDDLRGRAVTICISPNGHDTWRFNYTFTGRRDDGSVYTHSASNISLTQDSRCHSSPPLQF